MLIDLIYQDRTCDLTEKPLFTSANNPVNDLKLYNNPSPGNLLDDHNNGILYKTVFDFLHSRL